MAMHPLMKPAAWGLWTGASGMPSVRRAGAVFWLLGSVALATWLAGLLHEALVWGVPTLLLLSGLAVAIGWAWLAWSTWSAWCADLKRLTLLWTGPASPRNPQGGGQPGQGGFRVLQWQAPVRVEVILDLQRWMLLRVTAVQPSANMPASAPRQAWLWLHQPQRPEAGSEAAGARQEGGSACTLHQLRCLLHLPEHLTMARQPMPPRATNKNALASRGKAPLDGGAGRLPARAMASWLHSIKSGFTLRATPHLPRPPAAQAHAPLHAAARESSFPPTVVMRDEDFGDDRRTQRAGGHL
jgi:hypothetical protein